MGDPLAVREGQGRRAVVVGLLAVSIALARDSLARWRPAWWVPVEAAGYLVLLVLSIATIRRTGLRASDLGLGSVGAGTRVIGCIVLSAVFATPAIGRTIVVERPDALWVAFVAAPVEELVCRGVIFGLLARRGGAAFAVAASATTFAAMHAAAHPPLALVAALVAGLVLGAWRAISRDVVAPTVGHVVADVVAAVVV